jgi:hypothetical protein
MRIPDASETLRSEDVPPMSTVIFIRSVSLVSATS